MNYRFYPAVAVSIIFWPLLITTARPATAIIVASKDNAIFQSNSANSAGGAPGIHSGTNATGSIRRGLIAFDIAGNLPAGSIITSAVLRMYLGNSQNDDPQNIELHRLTRDWGEGTAGSTTLTMSGTGVGFPASAGDATWTDAQFGSESWTNPGATGDFIAAASAVTAVSGPLDTAFSWSSTPALVADVQSWLDAPSTNFGWILFNSNESVVRALKAFYSREATQNSSGVPNSLDPTWRPSLIISYASPLAADYNGNGNVDAADYVSWRRDNGPAGDYGLWRMHYGESLSGNGTDALVAVPEASGLNFVLIIEMWALFSSRPAVADVTAAHVVDGNITTIA